MYICSCNDKINTMKKTRSLHLDDEIVEKLKRIGKSKFGTENVSAAVTYLVKNHKEDK